MPRYRVIVVEEREFIDDVDAPSPAEAALMLSDRIRAGQVTPKVAGTRLVDAIEYRR